MKKTQVFLTIIFVVLTICLILLISPIFIWRSVTTEQAQMRSTQQQKAQVLSAQVRAFFEGAEEQLRSTIQVMNITESGRDEQEAILSSLLSENGLYEELVLLDNTGQEEIHLSLQEAGSSTNSGNWSDTEAFVIPQSTKAIYYGPVSFNEMTGEPTIVIGVPFGDANNENVLVAKLRFKEVWDLVMSTQLNSGENVYIVDDENRVVAHRNPSVVLRGTQFEVPEEDGISPGLDGVNAVVATDRIQLGEKEFVVVSEKAVSGALTTTSSLVLTLAVMGVVIIILVILASLGFGVMYRLVKPKQEEVQ